MKKLLIAGCAACFALYASAWRAEADGFLQTDLVSDIPGLARVTDPLLQNPWGFSFNPATGGGVCSPFWISNQVSNAATLYAVNGEWRHQGEYSVRRVALSPSPRRRPAPQGPTGQVFNFASPAFAMGNNGPPALFMFAN
jgi:hypothetical protein